MSDQKLIQREPRSTPIMIKLPDARESKIQFLAARKFPELYPWTSRRSDPKLVSLAELQSGARQYVDELNGKSDAELDREYRAERAKATEEARAKAEEEERARPFNQPYARAYVKHWAKMAYWTPDEAVALSFGRDPKFANWKSVEKIIDVSPFARKFAAQREIVLRAKTMGQLREKTTPALFLAWAERMQFPMPDELVDAVKSVGTPAPDWKSLFEQSQSQVQALASRLQELEREKPPAETAPLDPRERQSLLKLVIAMAVRGYTYEPSAKRSEVISEIADDVHLLGMSISEDTVRRHLANGKELLPKDEAE